MKFNWVNWINCVNWVNWANRARVEIKRTSLKRKDKGSKRKDRVDRVNLC